MQNKELNINEIVKIETLPKIFYELEKVGEYLDTELEEVKKLDVSEESKQSIKKLRANINDTLKQFEDKRKEIKNKCLEAYTLFEEKYNNEVKIKLTNASEDLKTTIDNIERKQIQQKEDEIFAFIDEHIHANHIESLIVVSEVIRFANLKINLSTSLKSLKEDAKAYIEKVANEIKLIELEEKYVDEILLEYTKDYDYTKAKLNVIAKHKELEELAKQREQVKEVVQQEEVVEKVVEEIVAPKEVIQEDELLEVTFTVKGTKPQILKIKDLLIELGVEYK